MAELEVKKHAPSGTIILNRPAKRNALSRSLIDELRQALEDFQLEKSVRAIIITGSGDSFCAGMDLTELHQAQQERNALELFHEDAVAYRNLMELIMRSPKPIIAAVNGPAVAGGAGLVLAADLVVASPSAVFGFPEARRGLVAGLVAPLAMFRLGGGTAARLLLSAALIDAPEALRLGIYDELVEAELIWARAHELACECAQAAPQSLQLTKQLLNETMGEHVLHTWLAAGAAASAASRTTDAAREGLQAFLDKRPPSWP